MKKYITWLLIICLFINIIPIPVLAEDSYIDQKVYSNDLSTDDISKENGTSPLTILANYYTFSKLSDTEKQKLCTFLGIERSLMEKFDQKGYPLKEAIDAVIEISNFKYNYEREIQGFNELNISDSKVSSHDIDQFIEYMTKGYSFKNITDAWEIGKIFGIDALNLIEKNNERDIAIITNKLKPQEIDIIKSILGDYFVNIEVLSQYRENHSLSWKEISDRINNYHKPKRIRDNKELISTLPLVGVAAGSESVKNNYDVYFRDIYSYKQNDQESISLNSGNLTYEKNIFNIPGRNGLDLSLDIMYKSSEANINEFSYNESADADTGVLNPYTATGTVNAYLYNPNTGWVSYPVSELNLAETELNSVGWFFEAFLAADEWESRTFYQKNYLHDGNTDLLVEYTAMVSKNGTQSTQVVNVAYPKISEEVNNYIASGWSFKLPYININYLNEPASLNLGEGSVFTIDQNELDSDLSNASNGLVNYSLNDIKLRKDDGSYSNGEDSSAYVLAYKNGNMSYFSSNGNLIGSCDRQGNTIKYFYEFSITNTDTDTKTVYKLNRIVDSLGRTTHISYNISGEFRIITITPPDQNAITLTTEKVSGTNIYALKSIKQPLIPDLVFEYTLQDAAFDFTSFTPSSVTNRFVNLTKIIYPAGGESKFTYQKTKGRLGYVGSYEYYRVYTREDVGNTISYNKDTYSYSGNFTGYPSTKRFSQYRDTGETYSTSVIHNNKIKETYYFNELNMKKSEESRNSSSKILQKVNYFYNIDKLPIKQIQTRYDEDSNNYSDTEKSWEYNDYGDVLSYVNEMQHNSLYTYDDKFHQVTTEIVELDENKIQNTEYYINSVTGNIDQTIKHYSKDGVPLTINIFYSYDSYGNIITSRTQKGNGDFFESRYEYSPDYNFGYLTKASTDVTDYVGNVESIEESYTYDFNTGRINTKTSDDKTTTYNYDELGRLVKEIYPDDSSNNIAYDDLNNSATLTLENNHKIMYKYDDLGRFIERQELINEVMVPVEKADYNNMNQLLWTEDALGNRTQYQYDGFGRVVKLINPDTTYIQTKYYDGQNKKIEINEEQSEHTYYYNISGNLVSESTFDGINSHDSFYEYDYIGNLIYKKDGSGNEANYIYDELNRLVEVINPLKEKVFYEYDNLDNMIKIIQQEYDSNGQLNKEIVTEKQYDELGRIIKAVDPLNKTEFYKYDISGNLEYKTDKNGQTVNYLYDNRNRIINRNGKDKNGVIDDVTTYDYSNLYDLNTINVTHNEKLTTYEYYSNGLLKKEEIKPDNIITSYEYDYNGNRSKMTDAFGLTVEYQYDSRNRLDIMVINSQKTFNYDYFDDGMISSIQYPTSSIITNFTYNDINRLTQLNNINNNNYDSYSYEYDLNNNLKSTTNNGITTNYSFDQLDRLTIVDQLNNNRKTNYSYDARGNKTKIEGYIPLSYINTTRDIKRNFNYNTLGQLTKFTAQNDTYNVFYKYNQDGLRTQKATPDDVTNYYYDNLGRTIAETDENGALKAQIVWGHKPLIRIINGQFYYYLYNGHGDVVQVVDESGNIVNNYKYDEWGNNMGKQESIENPIRYAGEYFDEESGLYYLRARYYDPEIARFISEDTNKGKVEDPLSLNLYTYSMNNPIRYYDPTGHSPQELTTIYTGDGGGDEKLAEYVGQATSIGIGFTPIDTAKDLGDLVAGKDLITGDRISRKLLLLCLLSQSEAGDIAIKQGAKAAGNAKGLIGKDFEDFLAKQLRGNGSFKSGGREFDGSVGKVWYEAKSGEYWDFLMSSEKNIAKFKSDMGDRLNIAVKNGASYELHSNTPIPQTIKDWLTKKGIPFKEW